MEEVVGRGAPCAKAPLAQLAEAPSRQLGLVSGAQCSD